MEWVGMPFWRLVGIGLALWVLYDLVVGYTYLHRQIQRSDERVLYWGVLLLWAAIAGLTWVSG